MDFFDQGDLSKDVLVQSWLEQSRATVAMRNKLSRENVPENLLDIFDLWTQLGPDCICTVSHPTELELPDGRLRFATFIEAARQELPIWRFPALDTITSSIGVKNPFGVASVIKVNRTPNTILDLCRVEFSNSVNVEGLAISLLENFQKEIAAELESLGLKNRIKNARKLMRVDIISRVLELHEICTQAKHDDLSIFTNNLQNIFFAKLFPEFSISSGPLNSEDTPWLSLVRTTAEKLLVSFGDELFINFCPEWNTVALSGVNQNLGLTKVGESMVLVNINTFEIVDSTPNLHDFLADCLPLAGLEILCQTAGLRTLQFGSEHGWRERSIEALKIQGESATLAKNLQVGIEGQHFNKIIQLLEFPKVSIPLPLLFVLLPISEIRELLIFGFNSSSPLVISSVDFKKFLAKSLVKNSINKHEQK